MAFMAEGQQRAKEAGAATRVLNASGSADVEVSRWCGRSGRRFNLLQVSGWWATRNIPKYFLQKCQFCWRKCDPDFGTLSKLTINKKFPIKVQIKNQRPIKKEAGKGIKKEKDNVVERKLITIKSASVDLMSRLGLIFFRVLCVKAKGCVKFACYCHHLNRGGEHN